MNFSIFQQAEAPPRLLVVLLFLFAIILRLLFIAEQSPLLIEQHPAGSDMLRYYTWAQKLSQGGTLEEVFFAPPLYPYLMAGVFKLSGGSLKAVLALQVVLGLISAYLLYRIARQFFPLPVALITLFVFLICGRLILYEQVLLTDSLSVFMTLLFLLAALALQTKSNFRRAVVLGVILGLAALNRPLMLSFLPLLVLWILFTFPTGLIKRLTLSLFIGVSVFLVILPATLHNYRQDGGLVLISYNGGVNFYLGNGEGAQGWFYYSPKYKEIRERMEQEKLTPSQQSKRWYRETLQYIESHPGTFVGLLWKKLNLFWGRWEIPHNLHYALIEARYPLLRTGLPTFGLIAPWGLLGIFILLLSSKRDPGLSFLVLFVAYYSLAVIMFLVVGRYRLPIIPLLILFAAHALWCLIEKLRQGEVRELLLYLVVWILLWLFINYKPLYAVLGA